jgi:hypothetical protein
MKKFIVFAGDTYYPQGGMKDFKGTFDTEQKVNNYLLNCHNFDWIQILNTQTGATAYHPQI